MKQELTFCKNSSGSSTLRGGKKGVWKKLQGEVNGLVVFCVLCESTEGKSLKGEEKLKESPRSLHGQLIG